MKLLKINPNRRGFYTGLCLLSLFLFGVLTAYSQPVKRTKARVIATTDGEIDDRSSMVRFLMYASDFDIEGIVQVNGVQKNGHSKDKWIEKLVAEYDKCLPNLKKHNPDYPDASYLLSIIKVGNENSGDLGKAPNLIADNQGAQHIIKILLDSDPRPVHILAWGGANTQANALWQIKSKHTAEEWKRAVAKTRLYCIWYQDGGGSWVEKNLPEIKIYEAGSPDRDGSWRYVWDYMSVTGKYKGRTSKNPKELQVLMDSPWLKENIKTGHGSLAAAYPQDYTSEGDTPSFIPLISNGLEHHVDYTLGGWGGRAVYAKGNHMEDGADDNKGKSDLHYTFQRWLPAAQNDWAARADWCVADAFSKANHQPIAAIEGDVIKYAAPGQTVTLDASPSLDPDNNTLSYSWWHYFEADNSSAKLTINNNTSKDNASFVVPNELGKQLHVILEVTDNGSPSLKSYQRIIISITTNTVLDDNDVSSLISIYPNPSRSKFNVNLPLAGNTQLYDMEGKLHEEYKNVTNFEFGENLKAGVYFLKSGSKVLKLIKE